MLPFFTLNKCLPVRALFGQQKHLSRKGVVNVWECAKLRGWCVIVGLVLPCLHGYFVGTNFLSRAFFLSEKVFFVGLL